MKGAEPFDRWRLLSFFLRLRVTFEVDERVGAIGALKVEETLEGVEDDGKGMYMELLKEGDEVVLVEDDPSDQAGEEGRPVL